MLKNLSNTFPKNVFIAERMVGNPIFAFHVRCDGQIDSHVAELARNEKYLALSEHLNSAEDQSRHLADQNSHSELWNLVTSLMSLKWFNLKCFVVLKKIWLISWPFEDIEQTLPHRFLWKKDLNIVETWPSLSIGYFVMTYQEGAAPSIPRFCQRSLRLSITVTPITKLPRSNKAKSWLSNFF